MIVPGSPPSEPTSSSGWLNRLQQDSWQLELLISGFAVFLLIGGRSALWNLEMDLILLQQTSRQFYLLDTIYYTTRIAYTALLVSLLIHVILRGLWIAAVGLRSVSGDIEYEALSYQPVFERRLRRGIGSFDRYIERLERYCSVFFSFAFLIIFCFLSMAVFTFTSILIANTASTLTGYHPFEHKGLEPGDVVGILLLALGLIYAIDFMSLGWLKRVGWWGKTYYYLYVFFGWLTLARLYRPLYYNLIDNGFGRRFARALPVCVFALLILSSLYYNGHAYVPAYGVADAAAATLPQVTYEDEEGDVKELLWQYSLNSRYAQNDYVELFAPYIPINDDQVLRLIDPKLPAGRNVGPYLRGAFTIGERDLAGADSERIVHAFRQQYRLYLNGVPDSTTARFYYHPRRQQHGLLYVIPLHDLPPGEHHLRLDDRQPERDSVIFGRGRPIFFYK